VNARLFLFGVTLIVLSMASAIGESGEKKADSKKALAKPGPMHQQLAKLAGEYTTVTKFMLKPGDDAKESQGSAKLKTILDGRFLVEEASGNLFGQKTGSMHLLGYNNGTGKYEGTWVYTGSTGMMTLVGTSKDDGKTIEFNATYELEKGVKTALSVVTRILDDDHFVTSLIAKGTDGNPGPTLETTYTRKK
jgi:hypothetical protein